MNTFLELSELWGIIYNGLIGAMVHLVSTPIPDWIIELFGVSSADDLDGVGEVVYNIIYEVLDAIPLVGTDETFASLSLMSIMLGLGLIFVIVFSLAKWLVGIIP